MKKYALVQVESKGGKFEIYVQQTAIKFLIGDQIENGFWY